MSISIVQRLFAFLDNVWSFILTLVRSLLALFSFRRRSSDPFALPRVNRAPKEALVRAHTRLRPILLTPRSISLNPAYQPPRARSTRSRSATSTLVPGQGGDPAASGSASQPSGPQRTSPKLDTPDSEVGSSVTPSVAQPSGTTSYSEETPEISTHTSPTRSFSAVPLTPPDRCYLAPMSSTTDCPYAESWPTNIASKSKLSGSPLKASINADPPFPETIGSPPPIRWSPVQIWTSTPYKNDNIVIDPAVTPSGDNPGPTIDPSLAMVSVSRALISRSRSSIHPYDDSNKSPDASPLAKISMIRPIPRILRPSDPSCERNWAHVEIARPKSQVFPQFHHTGTYACSWRRHGARVPGKLSCASRAHTHTRSYSQTDLPASERHDDGDTCAITSPDSVLGLPRRDSATSDEDEDEDEDEMPLNCLRDRLSHRNASAGGVCIDSGPGRRNNGPSIVPLTTDVLMAAMSPKTRRMSEGCLLAISQSTPTPVGMNARTSQHVISLAFGGDEHSSRDWLEALSLHFSSEQKEAPQVSTPPLEGLS